MKSFHMTQHARVYIYYPRVGGWVGGGCVGGWVGGLVLGGSNMMEDQKQYSEDFIILLDSREMLSVVCITAPVFTSR